MLKSFLAEPTDSETHSLAVPGCYWEMVECTMTVQVFTAHLILSRIFQAVEE